MHLTSTTPVLFALLAFGLSGCSGDDPEKDDTASTPDTTPDTSTDTSTGTGDTGSTVVSVVADLPEWGNAEAPEGLEVAGWTWQNPRPQGLDLWGVWGESADETWFAGSHGTMLRHDGTAFEMVDLGTTESLNAIHGGWVVGSAGTALRWDGSAWTATGTPTSAALLDVFAPSSDEAIAVSEEGEVLAWDGDAWSVTHTADVALRGVWDSWVAGDGVVLHWDGATWTSHEPDPSAKFFDIWGSGDDDVWVVGDHLPSSSFVSYLVVWHWNGSTWEDLTPDEVRSKADYAGIWVASDGTVHLAIAAGVYQFDGTQWHAQPSSTGSFSGVYGASDDEVWTVGTMGFIGRWDGKAYVELSHHETTENFYALTGFGGDDVFATGWDHTTIHHWDGSSWTGQPTDIINSHWEGYQKWFPGVWGSSSDDVWAAGYGSIAHWDGTAWEEVVEGGNHWGTWGSASDDVWFVGPSTARRWNGSTWEDHSAAFGKSWLRDVGGVDADTAWAVGDGGAIFAWDGETWTSQASPTGAYLSHIDAFSNDLAWAVGYTSSVLKWNGTSWAQEVLPDDTYPYWEQVVATAADEAWLVGGTDVLKWDGSAWSKVETPGGLLLNSIHKDPTAGVWVAGSNGQILHRP